MKKVLNWNINKEDLKDLEYAGFDYYAVNPDNPYIIATTIYMDQLKERFYKAFPQYGDKISCYATINLDNYLVTALSFVCDHYLNDPETICYEIPLEQEEGLEAYDQILSSCDPDFDYFINEQLDIAHEKEREYTSKNLSWFGILPKEIDKTMDIANDLFDKLCDPRDRKAFDNDMRWRLWANPIDLNDEVSISDVICYCVFKTLVDYIVKNNPERYDFDSFDWNINGLDVRFYINEEEFKPGEAV